MANTTYTVQQLETWTSIAYKMYGDVNKHTELMAANPNVPKTYFVQSGVNLVVPIIERDVVLSDNLPFWKR